jgi:16S rRNA (cytosine967-C5)-methyltransferase
MPVSAARAAAFDILLRVERDSAYASELLHSAAYQRLSDLDHSLATELVMGVLRWRSRLDDEISTASSQPLAKIDLEILIALRLALYQFRWLDRIPPRAALHESVELVKQARKRSAASFVNAVLRKLLASPIIKNSSVDQSPVSPQALARDFAHPLWMVERWSRAYGITAAHQLCRHNQSIPAATIRLRTPHAEAALQQQGISLASGALLASARRVLNGDITKTRTYRSGQIVIQDEASQLVAALVGPALQKTESSGNPARILDCCAAPGGKTLVLADRNPQAVITAVDLHPHRARLLQRLLHAGHIDPHGPNVHIVVADARQLPTHASFDRILADVPCSGTGTLARNPEIKWRLTPADLAALQKRQHAILLSALAQLAPGGRLVYSTCSLEKEENEDVIEHVLAQNNSFRLLDCATVLDHLKHAGDLIWSDVQSLTSGLYLRTLPGIHPCDGFFASILERA